MNTGKQTSSTFGALDAFLPAVLAYGGDLENAVQLQESCYYMWMQFDIEPEQFDYKTNKVLYANYVLRLRSLSRHIIFTTTLRSKIPCDGKNFLRQHSEIL